MQDPNLAKAIAEITGLGGDDHTNQLLVSLLSAPHGVELHGLSRADLNGKIGKASGMSEDGTRLCCDVPGVGRLSVKPANLKVAEKRQILRLETYSDRYEIVGEFIGLVGKDDFALNRNNQAMIVKGNPQEDPQSDVAGFMERVELPPDAAAPGSETGEFRNGMRSPRAPPTSNSSLLLANALLVRQHYFVPFRALRHRHSGAHTLHVLGTLRITIPRSMDGKMSELMAMLGRLSADEAAEKVREMCPPSTAQFRAQASTSE